MLSAYVTAYITCVLCLVYEKRRFCHAVWCRRWRLRKRWHFAGLESQKRAHQGLFVQVLRLQRVLEVCITLTVEPERITL